MAVPASFSQRSAGRSITSPHSSILSSTPASRHQSGVVAGDEPRAGAFLSSHRAYNSNVRRPRNINTNMASLSSTSAARSTTSYGKLHKRGGSGSSLPAPPSPFNGTPTPFATYEESFPDIAVLSTPPSGSTTKIKPYLRKMSAAKEKDDQGQLDLSRSAVENERLAGLGIHDSGANSRSASDVTFSHTGRRTPHMRTTSVGSQMSTGSGSFRPTQPFVHPMRQTPRPFTPPTGSYASSLADGEADESNDFVDDDFRLGHGFRSRRSMSIPSTPQIGQTPLSQSHTASDLGILPKLTSTSTTNLSIQSGKSAKSAKSSRSKLGRRRRDTGRSIDAANSPSSRTSFDKAFSFVSRRSEPDDVATRDERIREARRKFDEREAGKDRKVEKEALKRLETEEQKTVRKQERQRRKSETSQRRRPTTRDGKSKKNGGDSEKVAARAYDEYRPSNAASLPVQGQQAGSSEKTARTYERKAKPPPSGWLRFSTWFQTRLLSCGGSRS